MHCALSADQVVNHEWCVHFLAYDCTKYVLSLNHLAAGGMSDRTSNGAS